MPEPLTLTSEEERDLLSLIAWAFMSRPGIPNTAVLQGLYGRLNDRRRQEAGAAKP